MDITAQENEHNEKGKSYKIISLAAVSLGLQVLTWVLMSDALYGGKPLEFWFWVMLAVLGWMSSFAFFSMIHHNRWFFSGVVLAGLISYLAIFPYNIFVWLGGVVFAGLTYLFWGRVKSLEKNQSHFSIRHLVGGSIIILIYAFLVLLGFNIYYDTANDLKRDPEQFYESLGESAAKSFNYSERVSPDEVALNQSLDQFLIKHVPAEAQGNFDLTFARDEFLKRYGIDASGEESLADIFARLAVTQVREVASQYQSALPLIFTLVIIALLRTFAFVFYWLGILISWALFRILLAFKFFRITRVQVEVNKLEI